MKKYAGHENKKQEAADFSRVGEIIVYLHTYNLKPNYENKKIYDFMGKSNHGE